MLSLFGGWASTTTTNLLRCGWHSPLHSAFAGNSLILVALYKESSLHPPSKLLYRCLATTDLLVGLVPQPLNALYWVSVFQENWSLCRYAFDATKTIAYVLLLVTLMTMTAISVDRRDVGTEIQTNCNFEAHVYYFNCLLGFYSCRLFKWIFSSPYNLSVQLPSCIILPGNITRIVRKYFLHSQISSSASAWSTADEPNKYTEHGAIQKGSVPCTVGAISISCLFCTNIYSGNCDRSY